MINCIVVSLNPTNVWIFFEPSHLFLAIDSRISLDFFNGKGQIITVCGAGGNRDKGKRPLMAQEAAKRSDRVIITSDNPRFERPEDIIADMLAGLDEAGRAKTLAITDRREAIRTAAALAQAGDVILVAGKGHEPYQEIEGVKHHFDDHEEVRAAFGIA